MLDPRDILRRTLEANPKATIDELNAALATVVARYNQQPQAELGGLSPDVAHRLLSADWSGRESAIQLNDSLSLATLGPAHTLHRARIILEMLAEHGAAKATPKGNLPRTFVTEFRERVHAVAEESDFAWGDARNVNERDYFPLHIPRLLLEISGLLKRREGLFSLTKRGEGLSGDDRAGKLLTTLLREHFRKLNLSYLDGAPPAPEFQRSIGATLFQFSRSPSKWRLPEEMAGDLILPSTRDAIPANPYTDMQGLILETRFLRPLVGFGLAEVRRTREDGELRIKRAEFRRSPLFERVVSFRLG